MEIPQGFPSIDFPEGNAFSETRWALGKKLFFDPVMSANSSISCATCHLPELAFSDNQAFSPGVENRPGTRNASPLFNLAYHPYFTREGGVPTLEMQILVPIQEHNEFDFNIVLIAERLAQDSTYQTMAQLAYDREPDAFVITRALANFERSLLSGYSRYDQHFNYDLDKILTASELRGRDLFFSKKTDCANCHGDSNFTNYDFQNNGLYESYEDVGRFRLTGLEADRALFKVPSLRNIELTAPYMHDGSMVSLEEIVDHYNSGGKNNPQKSNLIRPLNLTDSDKNDLVNFLKTLTDEAFVSNPIFQN
ncbi:MAG: cytochrome c peroxidase [Saprospiraceae bacterium]|jgi:cytochrome c peroxidase